MNDGQEIVADYETFSDKMNYYIGIRQEIGEETGQKMSSRNETQLTQ